MQVHMKMTPSAPAEARKEFRSHRYRNQLPPGAGDDELVVSYSEAIDLRREGWAEDFQDAPKPPEPAEQPRLTRPKLMAIAIHRGMDLPAHYLTRDELVKMVGNVTDEERELAEAETE